jgi:hypothetical protein
LPENHSVDQRIIVQDARDDRGRKHIADPGSGEYPLAHSDKSENNTVIVNLPPDAKSWNLTVLVEPVTTVEFTVRPPPVK